MRYHALACDYDGTIAEHSVVPADVLAALGRVRQSGRRLVLVTGRQVDDLLAVFPETAVFDCVVAENGAVLYEPATQERTVLAEAPPLDLDRALHARGVTPLARGHVIVATWRPHETAVLEVIRELGLELQVIFNKDAVMVLPSGVNKASGLAYALARLRLSPHETVGVGDAENDHAFLALCECAVAVSNALPSLKERADWVTAGARGTGVRELIEALLADDLAGVAPRLTRHDLPIGVDADGHEVHVPPFGERLLLAGTSGSGKSTFAKGFLEGLVERGHQILVVDPEGDYEKLDWAGTLGDQQHAPTVEEAMTLLQAPEAHLVLNLLGIPHADRPAFFAALVPRLQEMHAQTGRPHWVIVDEAHHLLPDATAQPPVPYDIHGLMFITVHPEHVARTAVEAVHRVIVVGGAPAETVRRFAEQKAVPPPNVAPDPLPSGEAITWRPGSEPVHIRSVAPRAEHRRHVRKYAEGELGPERSFFFRGPEERLNLRAHNLQLFVQLADGVDDETWMHHLRRGDYSRWFRESIKDDELAQEAQAIEADPRATAADSRERIRSLVDARYTTPA